LWCFYLVPIAPVTPGVLHIVVEDELIHGRDHIEVILPRDVVGLKDGDFFHYYGLISLKFQVG
jgi:hypothetical protein